MEYLRDLKANWGEPIIVKKPKGIALDLTVTGQWAVVVRCIMNGSVVLKVYLIQLRKCAYRLQCQQAILPMWVLEALEQVSSGNATIGFEDVIKVPDKIDLMINVADAGQNRVQNNETKVDDAVEEENNNETQIIQQSRPPMRLMRAIDTIEELLDEE